MTPTNRLIHETSPYLLQHAHNPVDWYPWGQEALEKAKAEDKPILLSIGYSACHWCHVMERESFEDEATAATMNEHFVNVKVDREERPDLDAIYMQAVQAMTGSGGWPMTVFLTPDGVPFYGGTYFPPESRHGLPGFRQVLLSVSDAYHNRRGEVKQGSASVLGHLRRELALDPGQGDLSLRTLDQAVHVLGQQFDPTHGGFGSAPKFPQAMSLDFLLSIYARTGNRQALRIVERTLGKMARGGIYDQLGGGFHRYSVDARWLVPHFEKMLYDNALLARLYLHAYQATGKRLYRRIAQETLDYVAREMTSPEGGFYSTQDADSEGEEGKFYVWTPAEVRAVLGEEAELFCRYFDVTEGGNWEGRSILNVPRDPDVVAHLAGVSEEQVMDVVSHGRRALFEARERRVRPGRDDKVLTSWNGLMLAAFAEAARVLGRDDGSTELAEVYLQVAERNADFLLRELKQDNGRLLHTWKDGEARFNGYLEDYSYLIEGLLELYQATFDPRWVLAAQELAEAMIAHFQAPGGGFFDTSDDHETLITRPRDVQDNATPSGNAMAATALLRLAGLANEPRYVELAHESLAQVQSFLAQYPLGFGQWLQALAYALSKPREIAIVGDPDSADTQALLNVVRDGYEPFQVVALGSPDTQSPPIPLLQDRGLVDGQPAAYVCRDFVCQAPVTEPGALQALLKG